MKKAVALFVVVAVLGSASPAQAHRTPKVHKHGNGHAALHQIAMYQRQTRPPAFMEWRDGTWFLRVDCDSVEVLCDDEGA